MSKGEKGIKVRLFSAEGDSAVALEDLEGRDDLVCMSPQNKTVIDLSNIDWDQVEEVSDDLIAFKRAGAG